MSKYNIYICYINSYYNTRNAFWYREGWKIEMSPVRSSKVKMKKGEDGRKEISFVFIFLFRRKKKGRVAIRRERKTFRGWATPKSHPKRHITEGVRGDMKRRFAPGKMVLLSILTCRLTSAIAYIVLTLVQRTPPHGILSVWTYNTYTVELCNGDFGSVCLTLYIGIFWGLHTHMFEHPRRIACTRSIAYK